MITDDELNEKINKLCEDFHGQSDDLYTMIGMVVAGRRYGWEVVRITSNRRDWARAAKLLGDLKELMPRRGYLAHRSRGLWLADQWDSFWEIVQGHKKIPLNERRGLM